jgi:hypothetical protein
MDTLWGAKLDQLRRIPESERSADLQQLLRCEGLLQKCAEAIQAVRPLAACRACRQHGLVRQTRPASVFIKEDFSFEPRYPSLLVCTQGWQSWPRDGSNDAAVLPAISTLLAAAEAAPIGEAQCICITPHISQSATFSLRPFCAFSSMLAGWAAQGS